MLEQVKSKFKYHETSKGLLINGECFQVMEVLRKANVVFDAIITDVPYGTTACKWDTALDFETMWFYLHSLSNDTTPIALFGSEPFSSALRMSNIKNYKYDWVWNKTRPVGFAHAKNMPLKNTEIVSMFSKGIINHEHLTQTRMVYNPQDLIPSRHIRSNKNRGQKKGWKVQ